MKRIFCAFLACGILCISSCDNAVIEKDTKSDTVASLQGDIAAASAKFSSSEYISALDSLLKTGVPDEFIVEPQLYANLTAEADTIYAIPHEGYTVIPSTAVVGYDWRYSSYLLTLRAEDSYHNILWMLCSFNRNYQLFSWNIYEDENAIINSELVDYTEPVNTDISSISEGAISLDTDTPIITTIDQDYVPEYERETYDTWQYAEATVPEYTNPYFGVTEFYNADFSEDTTTLSTESPVTQIAESVTESSIESGSVTSFDAESFIYSYESSYDTTMPASMEVSE